MVEVARKHGLRAHLDGARLMNAVVASGETAAAFASGFDTAWIDFTKGLGAPVGACLAGSQRADRGGLALQADAGRSACARPGSWLPAACTRSTTTSIDWPRTTPTHALLADGPGGDRRRRHRRGRGRDQHRHLRRRRPAALVARLAVAGVEMSRFGPTRVRAVTHLDVDADGIDRALVAVRDALRE